MRETQKNNIRLAVSLMLMILAFFCGYLYAMREISISKSQQETYYIDLSVSSRGINITNMPKNIFLRVDEKLIQTGSIDLK